MEVGVGEVPKQARSDELDGEGFLSLAFNYIAEEDADGVCDEERSERGILRKIIFRARRCKERNKARGWDDGELFFRKGKKGRGVEPRDCARSTEIAKRGPIARDRARVCGALPLA